MSLTTKSPRSWAGMRALLKDVAAIDPVSMEPGREGEVDEAAARRELSLWLAPLGAERVQSVSAWLAAWCFQRPLYLQGVLMGYPFSGADVLDLMGGLVREDGQPTSIEFGFTADKPPRVVARYTWAGTEPCVWVRCPRIQAEGWPMATPKPPMPDAWMQGPPDLRALYPPKDQEAIAQWSPGRLDVGLDHQRTAAPADPSTPSPTGTSSASAGKTTSTAPTAPGGPAGPAAADKSHGTAPTAKAGAAGPAAPGDDPTSWPSHSIGLSDAQGRSTLDERPEDESLEGDYPGDHADAEDRAADARLFVPMATVQCVLCRERERLKLADVVERFKLGCPKCKKDPGAIVVLEEENGGTKPLVDYMRAAGVGLPVAAPTAPAAGGQAAPAATPASPTTKAEPRKRPSRKPAATQEGH